MWTLNISVCDCNVVYAKGTENTTADLLSRNTSNVTGLGKKIEIKEILVR